MYTAALNLASEYYTGTVLDSKMGRKQNSKGRRKCTFIKTPECLQRPYNIFETAVFYSRHMRTLYFEVGYCN